MGRGHGPVFEPGDVDGLTSAAREVLDDPAPRSGVRWPHESRLTADFDWHKVAEETVQVYAAAKRRVRHPLARPQIPERPLPVGSGRPVTERSA